MPKLTKKSSRPKRLYRVRNWREYEKALVQRGSLTFWLTDDFEKVWLYAGEKQRGSQFEYSEKAIEIMLTLKEVFHLSNRGVEGFMCSLFAMLNLHLPVPDHTTLSKRGKSFTVRLPRNTSGCMNLVLDSTGLKIYGEGEWKVRKHGYSKHRTWRKLHVGANPDNGEIQVAVLTGNSTSDAAVVKEMLAQIEQTLLSCAADGAYDQRQVYQALDEHSPEVEVLIPPRKNAHIWQHGNSKEERLKRDENLRYIRQYGRQQWKEDSGYHIRSLAETIMFRLKIIFGDKLSARLLETQTSQALIRCLALNRITHLGMPQSYLVA
jgi:IS5 family transposase